MKREIQGKKPGTSTMIRVLFTKCSLFTRGKKPKKVWKVCLNWSSILFTPFFWLFTTSKKWFFVKSTLCAGTRLFTINFSFQWHWLSWFKHCILFTSFMVLFNAPPPFRIFKYLQSFKKVKCQNWYTGAFNKLGKSSKTKTVFFRSGCPFFCPTPPLLCGKLLEARPPASYRLQALPSSFPLPLKSLKVVHPPFHPVPTPN